MSAGNHSIAMFVLAGLSMFASSPAQGQTTQPVTDDKGLLPMVPPDAVLFLEHRGHTAVKEAFEASNLGKMYKDEAITQFVQDTRVQIGQMIMKKLFDLPALKTDPAELQKTLHKVLRSFWNNPAAMFVVIPKGNSGNIIPDLGFICVMDEKSRAEAKPALDSLMQIGVPSAGTGTRQAFKWKTEKLEWNGVAMAGAEFTLSSTPDKLVEDLKDKVLFMTCWTDKHLLVAISLSAAASMGKAMAKPDANMDKNETLARIVKKTALKDWAFRWFVDVDAIRKGTPKDYLEGFSVSVPLIHIHGAGGTGGFADNVFTRLSYIDGSGAGEGELGLIKPGGNYKAGLAMMPRQTTFMLAGQIDPAKIVSMVRARSIALAKAQIDAAAGENSKPGADSKPASKPEPKLDETTTKVIAALDKLAGATGGNGGIFITDLHALFAGYFGGSAIPEGMVLDIKDKAKATAAFNELIKLSGAEEAGQPTSATAGTAPAEPNKPELAKVYRKVTIRRIAYNGYFQIRLGIMEDRVVLAGSDDAFKTAVDAALDKKDAFDPEGDNAKMLQLCGQGSVVFSMDLAILAKVCWPLLSAVAENPSFNDSIPLGSLPTTQKLVGFLGPEVAVFQPDDGGLLFKSRGKIPFATKFMGYYLFLGSPYFPFTLVGG
jgi:hypothetical protein